MTTVELLQAEVKRLQNVIYNAERVIIDHDLDGTVWYDQHTTLADYLRVQGQVCPLLRGERPLFPDNETISDSALVDVLALEVDKLRSENRELKAQIECRDIGISHADALRLCDAIDHLSEAS